MLPVIRSSKALDTAMARDLPKYFVREEIDLILNEVKGNPKHYLFLTMLWRTGARVSEMLRVKVKDVNVRTGTIVLNTLKRKKKPKRVLPIMPDTVGLIATHVVKHKLDPEDRLFEFTRERAFAIVKKAALKAGLDRERAHPHTFRHSFAVNCLLQKKPVPITVLQEWMGHANIQNTLIYLKILAKDAREYFENMEF